MKFKYGDLVKISLRFYKDIPSTELVVIDYRISSIPAQDSDVNIMQYRVLIKGSDAQWFNEGALDVPENLTGSNNEL